MDRAGEHRRARRSPATRSWSFKKGGTLVKTFTVAAGKTSYQAKLKGGKYRFAVVALNAVGAGPQSALSKKVTAQ